MTTILPEVESSFLTLETAVEKTVLPQGPFSNCSDGFNISHAGFYANMDKKSQSARKQWRFEHLQFHDYYTYFT